MAGDLNAKYPFWHSIISNPSGVKLFNLLHINEFEISAPQYPTDYSPTGNGDVLDIVVHKKIRLPEVIVSDILDLDQLPIIFHFVDHRRSRNPSDTIEKFRVWEQF
jgi:hypothetical protein